jgi:putative transposase
LNQVTAYRALFRYQLDPGLVNRIRAATNSHYALGSGRSEEEVAKALARREVRGRSGRPKRRRDAVTVDLQGPER